MTNATATPPTLTPTSTPAAPAPERAQLIDAAAKLIFDLLGMKPPPTELITPETFGPLHAFVDQVQAIVAASRGPITTTPDTGLTAAPVIYVDVKGDLVSQVSAEQVESVLGPHVDQIRSAMARQEGAVTPAEPLWNSKGNVIHAAVDRLGAAQRAAAALVDSPAAAPPGMAAPGTWVCDGGRVAKVREVHVPTKHEPGGCYDLVMYARDGKKIGRGSPAMGGPRRYEPFCSAENWHQIEDPHFPLPRYGDLSESVRFMSLATVAEAAPEESKAQALEAPRP